MSYAYVWCPHAHATCTYVRHTDDDYHAVTVEVCGPVQWAVGTGQCTPPPTTSGVDISMSYNVQEASAAVRGMGPPVLWLQGTSYKELPMKMTRLVLWR